MKIYRFLSLSIASLRSQKVSGNEVELHTPLVAIEKDALCSEAERYLDILQECPNISPADISAGYYSSAVVPCGATHCKRLRGTHLRRDTMCHNGFRLLKPRPPVTGMPGVFE
jgi:hypothetical protein